jgi:hypothetical protein
MEDRGGPQRWNQASKVRALATTRRSESFYLRLAVFGHISAELRGVRVGELDVAVWLHTVNDPPEAEWHQACLVQGDYVLSKHGDLSAYRVFVVSDGAAPNTAQRKEYFKEVLRGYPVKTAVVTTILRTSAAKRGIATALHWFNPNFRVFEPKDIVLATDHIGVRSSGFDPLWKALTLMQRKLPSNATLALVATQFGHLPVE